MNINLANQRSVANDFDLPLYTAFFFKLYFLSAAEHLVLYFKYY